MNQAICATRLGLTCLVVASGVLTVLTPGSASGAGQTVTGLVFRDYDADGVQDAGEPGVGGVSVQGFIGVGAPADPAIGPTSAQVASSQVASSVSGSTGAYALAIPAGAVPVGGSVRVEFSLPSTPALKHLRPGVMPAGGQTDVQFVSIPPAPGETIDWAVQNPNDYCGSVAETRLVTNCWKFGDQSRGRIALGSFLANKKGISIDPTSKVSTEVRLEATETEIGTTYGLGLNRGNRMLFSGAYVRRHAGVLRDSTDRTRGVGVVYAQHLPVSGAQGSVNPAPWVDLNALFPSTLPAGRDTHPDGPSPAFGGYPGADTNDPTLLASYLQWFYDVDTWTSVNKIGLGDVEVTEDSKYLFVVSLADRHVNRMSAWNKPASAGDVARIATPLIAGCAVDSRPFALAFSDGVGYLGVTCTAETSQKGSDLRAFVYSFDPEALDSFTEVLNVDLSYKRAAVGTSARPSDQWVPWSDEFEPMLMGNQVISQEPLLSAISIVDNEMVLGLRNRIGDRLGADEGHPYPTPNNKSEVYKQEYGLRGSILLGCRTGGVWKLESAGRCNTQIEHHGNDLDGPGGKRFFERRSDETMGGLTRVRSWQRVDTTMMDPNGEFQGGTSKFWMGPTGSVGGEFDPFTIEKDFTSTGAENNRSHLFGKSNGLGDLEALCDMAPIEVGNRVWHDTNDNGIQDPDEAGIAGVSVRLVGPNGQTADVTTDADGGYLFSSARSSADSSVGRTYAVPFLRLDNSAWGSDVRAVKVTVRPGQPTLPLNTGPKMTFASAGTRADSNFTDANAAATWFTTGDIILDEPGVTRHDIDLGFGSTPLVPSPKFSISGSAWREAVANGVRGDAGETPATLRIDLVTQAGVLVSSAGVTDEYTFTELSAGIYRVRFTIQTATDVFSPGCVGTNRAIDSDACSITTSVGLTNFLVLDDSVPLVAATGLRQVTNIDAAITRLDGDLPPT